MIELRKPSYLSHSSRSLWEKDREEFFVRHLAPVKAPKIPQQTFMAIGSSFDAYAKSALYAAIFGAGSNAKYEFDAIFADQVEPQNRDWAKEHGQYVFDCYCATGSFQELLAVLLESREPPQFEFKVERTIGGVPIMGKPDCRFVHPGGAHVILDWKVRGYCSKSATSPSKGYALCRDGYQGKPSRSHGKEHALYLPIEHRGTTIHAGYLEDSSTDYADQISVYGWLLGEEVGDEQVVCCIDEIVAKPGSPRPLLRVANHRARVRRKYQLQLQQRYQDCWNIIQSGLIFSDNPDENQERIEIVCNYAASLTDNDWFSEVVRPAFR